MDETWSFSPSYAFYFFAAIVAFAFSGPVESAVAQTRDSHTSPGGVSIEIAPCDHVKSMRVFRTGLGGVNDEKSLIEMQAFDREGRLNYDSLWEHGIDATSSVVRSLMYDSEGKLMSECKIDKTYGEVIRSDYKYDSLGRAFQKRTFSQRHVGRPDGMIEWAYSRDTLLDRVTEYLNDSVISVTDYAYDSAGRRIGMRLFRPIHMLETRCSYVYKDVGICEMLWYDGRERLQSGERFERDSAGRLMRRTVFDGQRLEQSGYRYRYDSLGRLVEVAETSASGTEVDRILYEYDSYGCLERRIDIDSDRTKRSEIVYEYEFYE